LCLLVSLPWVVLLGLHLALVHAAFGDLSIFFGRAGERGLRLHRLGSDLAAVGTNWAERLGVPQLLLALGGAVLVWRRYRDDAAARRPASAEPTEPVPSAPGDAFRLWPAYGLATVVTSAALMVGLLGWFAVHRYGLHLLLPSLALLGGGALVRLFRGGTAARVAGIVLLLAGVALFGHRLRRHEPPSAYERDLAELAAAAGRHATGDPEAQLLMVVDKNVMGARMSVLYYSGLPDYRVLESELNWVEPARYAAILGTDVNDILPDLIARWDLAPAGLTVRNPVAPDGDPLGTLFLYLPPRGAAAPPAAEPQTTDGRR
jgi:hypothetical protein